MTVLGCVAIVALLTVLGIGGYLAFSGADPASGGDPANGGRPVTKGHDITSQQADPAPLTLAEVFPGAAVTPAGRPYQLVKSQSSANCRSAVVGDLGDLVSAAGCTQVQRATFTSPDKTYVATAGVFNLRDEASATRVAAGIQTSLSGAKGRLSGYPAGGATDVLGRAATRAGWDVRGHFLIYAVVARVDGAQITDEAAVRPIIEDLVERYLNQTVLQARSAKSGP
jgi:hypothetical protein